MTCFNDDQSLYDLDLPQIILWPSRNFLSDIGAFNCYLWIRIMVHANEKRLKVFERNNTSSHLSVVGCRSNSNSSKSMSTAFRIIL